MAGREDEGTDLVKPVETPKDYPARSEVMKYIGQRYEVELEDGRLVRGTLLCTDRDANMIFCKADERWEANEPTKCRWLGQAMISKKHVKKMVYLAPPKETSI